MSGNLDSVTEIHCECGTPRRLAEDRRYPIVFDPEVGEYGLDSIDGRWRQCLFHCPWCGGLLPSKRHTLFTDPDSTETADVDETLSGAKSLDTVIGLLGKPDRSIDATGFDGPDTVDASGRRQRAVHLFRNRWTTLEVFVIEYDDDSISYVIGGKYKGHDDATQKKSKPWWSRLFRRPRK